MKIRNESIQQGIVDKSKKDILFYSKRKSDTKVLLYASVGGASR